MESNRLTVYIKDGCHLCENLIAEIEPYQKEMNLLLDIISIENDHKLLSLYASKVPVLMLGDTEICHYFFDVNALRDALRLPPQ